MKASLVCIGIVSVLLGSAGCATTAKVIQGPDGTEHQLVTCGAVEDCYSKATGVCGGKYKVINTTTEVSGDQGVTSSIIKLLVKCSE